MKHKYFIIGFLIGMFLTYFIMLIALSASYGRLSNHLNCDLSKNNIETLK